MEHRFSIILMSIHQNTHITVHNEKVIYMALQNESDSNNTILNLPHNIDKVSFIFRNLLVNRKK